MPPKKRPLTDEEKLQELLERKKRRTEQQRARRQQQRDDQQPGPSTSINSRTEEGHTEEKKKKDRERKLQKRISETSNESVLRRQKNRISNEVFRTNESTEKRINRQQKDAINHVLKRKNETEKEREHRQQRDLLNHRLSNRNEQQCQNRQQETAEQRENRLKKKRQSIVNKHKTDPNFATDLATITLHSLGQMNLKCNECKAKHFNYEPHNANNSFESCCGKGNVVLPPQSDFPDILKKLYKDQHPQSPEFKKNIRGYMRNLSFGTIVTKEVRFNGGGPYTYRQVGEFQRKFNTTAYADPTELPSFGQLFMLESDEANGIRQNVMKQLDTNLLRELDALIRLVNPFAKSYIMLKEEEEKAQQLANSTNTAPPEFKLLFCLKDNLDQRRFNPPRVNEVAVVFEQGADGEIPRYEICVNEHGRKDLKTLRPTNKAGEPLLFTLFYPTGQCGWHPEYKCNNRKITNADYVKYKLYDRDEEDHPFCPILYGGKAFQEWLVTQYINIDRGRLDYLKANVSEQLAENYDYLEEYLNEKAEETGLSIGKKFILPSSYIGSPRYMKNAYDDALTLTREFGKPDLFITMTCNPDWPEIKNNLKPGQVAADRPDLVARVFRIKYKEMIDYIVKSQIFGKVLAYTGSIEFQKRGLPHLHCLIILATKLNTKELIDEVICAEIPDITLEPVLHSIITRNNMHQCFKLKRNGEIYKKFPCIEKTETCSKHFPKKFLEETEPQTGGYANYRRRNNGVTFTAPDGQVLDNRHVVSYSPQLTKRFECHINVEHVADIQVVKYLHKYVFKGVDQALIEKVSKDGSGNQLVYDEIQRYIECRYLSAPEAAWRTLGYEIIAKSHAVQRLEIHDEGKQYVFFKKNDTPDQIEEKKTNKKSTLMAFFELNKEREQIQAQQPNPSFKPLLYPEVTKDYTWEARSMKWKKRVQISKNVGRIYSVSPRDSERFHLRLLLLRIRGPNCFQDLKTVNGVVQSTYQKACLAHGFIKDDEDYKNAMKEAVIFQMPKQLRFMFAMLLIHCSPTDSQALYEQFKKDMSEDCVRKYGDPEGYNVAYNFIERILTRNGKSFSDFSMESSTEFTDTQLLDMAQEPELEDEDSVEAYKMQGEQMLESCNEDQLKVVDKVQEMLKDRSNRGKCLFLDGPGGTGKTFVYRTLYNILRGNKKKVLCMAFTGIAATLLPNGNTIHTTFKFGLDLDQHSTSGFSNSSKFALDLARTDVFIIDEASMVSKHMLEAIDRSLREFTGKRTPFGGKIMLLGGDFRQILPIKEGATPNQTVRLTIKGSPLWSGFEIVKLTKNMRAGTENIQFANDILQIGEGLLNNEKDEIDLPTECVINKVVKELENLMLINEVFGAQITDANRHVLTHRSILAPLNVEVDELNEKALAIVEGDEKVYHSRDEIKEEDDTDKYGYITEFLNSLGEANFPKSELKLKKNAVVMIVRNLDIKNGLCNGTRLRIDEMRDHVLKCEVLTGEKVGEFVFIPRITLENKKNLPVSFYRNQFPVRLAFAMTINKSQGQTFETIGLKLSNRQVFSHGQLYVAISRVQNWKCLKILTDEEKDTTVTNIVYKEVL